MRQLLDPLGIAIEMAALLAVEAKRLLGDTPVLQAIDYYVKRHPTKIAPRGAKDVMEEMLKAKQGDGLSESYLQHPRYDLEKFTVGLLHNFRTGEILPPARTNEQEVELIKNEPPPLNITPKPQTLAA